MIKVVIADDHPIVRQGLRQILSGIPDMEVAGEAGADPINQHLTKHLLDFWARN